ncbi:MAG TPA: transposase [Pyrinomonadaceae bacterium]|jgi:REP element-mobilizing transposase RayT
MMQSSADASATTVCDAPALLNFPRQATAAKPLSLHYHIVFHLDKDCVIDEEWRRSFYKYIAGCLRALKCDLEAIGGAGDHIHLLVSLNSTDVLADVVRRLKLLSQSWVRRHISHRNFSWREDYQAFTVSQSQSGRVKRYILNQKQHHQRFGAIENYPASWGCVPHHDVCV